jgi:hypothetical protein
MDLMEAIDVADIPTNPDWLKKAVLPITQEEGKTGPSLFRKEVEAYARDRLPKSIVKPFLILVNQAYRAVFPQVKTQEQYFSFVRKIISERFGAKSPEYAMSLELMRIDQNVKYARTDAYDEKLRERNQAENVLWFDLKQDVSDVVSANWNSQDEARAAVALMLASGCRPIDLLVMNTFAPDTRGDNWMKVSDIAKKRKKDFTTTRPLIYLRYTQFSEAVKRVRKGFEDRYAPMLDGKNQLKPAVKAILSARVRDIYGEARAEADDITPMTLRKLYANAAHELYSPQSTKSVFISQILGHEPNNLKVSQAYTTVRFRQEAGGVIPGEVLLKTQVLETKLAELEQKLAQIAAATPTPAKTAALLTGKSKLFRDKTADVAKIMEAVKELEKEGKNLSFRRVAEASGVSLRTVQPILNDYRLRKQNPTDD